MSETKKISVVICAGTLCHVVGGSELFTFTDLLSDEHRACVDVGASICLGCCKNSGVAGAPFAKIDEAIISEATPRKLADAVTAKLAR